ncbi:MAG: LPXTG cell wall anchor domain-containing protein [Clostridia bacterium]|nr:LPXTG cell wall anchor domain-containing protein [Clostridia bacterium]
MTDYIIQSVQTGDDFNPVLIFAIAAACLIAAIFLIFSKRR